MDRIEEISGAETDVNTWQYPRPSPMYLDSDGQWKLREPDESRLLTEIGAIRACKTGLPSDSPWEDIAKAQDAKTAPIVREETLGEIEDHLSPMNNPPGTPEYYMISKEEWQVLKEREELK